MSWVYTDKAEKDGLGKAGEPIKPIHGTIAYLELHGYCVDRKDDQEKSARRGTSSALSGSSSTGALRSSGKVKS